MFCEANGVPHRWSIGSAPLSPLLAQASALVLAWLFPVSAAMAYDARRVLRLPPEPGP